MHTNISLQQLRYIIEVAECGSINAASQQLYVSQPTLSTTIKDTEQELGISHFLDARSVGLAHTKADNTDI